MNLDLIGPGRAPPDDVYALIEIPGGGQPVKYEFDKGTGLLFVDRFLHTAMFYPGNYGFIPCTLAEDGDPTDVLVVGPEPVVAGSVLRCRPIGALMMSDEKGRDEKILAVPVDELYPFHSNIHQWSDLPEVETLRIAHFFQHYKDLERGKHADIQGWVNAAEAKTLIQESIERAKR